MPTNLSDREWRERLKQLNHFRQAHGHCRIPPKWQINPALARWVGEQRTQFGCLPLDRLETLYRFGFDFRTDRYWLSRFFELVEYKRVHGHCNVPARAPQKPQLGMWLSSQRARRDSMPVQRRKLFDKLGVDWSPLESAWNQRYTELCAFKELHGHCRVPTEWPENPALALWVDNQRHRRHRLAPRRKRLLARLGFVWNPYQAIWQNHLRELKRFRRRFGHCNVPARWTENTTLASWVFELRERKDRIPVRWKRRLNALGFEWSPLRAQWWETRFRELKAFHEQHGHCNVPKGWPVNPALGDWVSTQRTCRQMLSRQRRRRLERAGFVWELIAMSPRKTWEERFQELAAFKKRFGHCNVPGLWPENQPLAEWVLRQRGRDLPRLNAAQRRRLDRLGFCWAPRESHWEERLAELKVFHRRFGHCDVPGRWRENPQLGAWVHRQRGRSHTLGSERVRQLDQLKFRWRTRMR